MLEGYIIKQVFYIGVQARLIVFVNRAQLRNLRSFAHHVTFMLPTHTLPGRRQTTDGRTDEFGLLGGELVCVRRHPRRNGRPALAHKVWKRWKEGTFLAAFAIKAVCRLLPSRPPQPIP